MSYQLLDSGQGEKLERFGAYVLIRPCPQAIWEKQHPTLWETACARFSREKEGERWAVSGELPASWTLELGGVIFRIAPTEFGHLGVFPEHAFLWEAMRPLLRKEMKVLNLFAYSGGATLAAAQEGASVCHLDASKGMVDWARQMASLNGLQQAPIRWIVEDVFKFLKREEKRGSRYDGIILDPPTFGRGRKKEVFKIERDFGALLQLCRALLTENPAFVFVSCHTPGITPLCLVQLLQQTFPQGCLQSGELALSSPEAFAIPSGSFAKWTP